MVSPSHPSSGISIYEKDQLKTTSSKVPMMNVSSSIGKLNNLEHWGADIGNAYLEAVTEEKLYIVDGPEFEDWEG